MGNNVIILYRYGHLLNLARSHNQEEEEVLGSPSHTSIVTEIMSSRMAAKILKWSLMNNLSYNNPNKTVNNVVIISKHRILNK